MRFKKWLFFEIFGGFSYRVPEDKEEQLYDFYMLSYLRGLSSFDLSRKSFRDKTGYDIGQFSIIRPDPTEMDYEDKIDYMLKEVADTLLPTLKDNLLAAVFFSLCAEFHHVFEKNEPKWLVDDAKEKGEAYAKGLINYIKRFTLHTSSLASDFTRLAEPEQPDMVSSKEDRQHSYSAALKSGLSRQQFVQLMEYFFENAQWNYYYGGPAWAKICHGWLKLNAAQKDKDLTVWIDHIYDLQHNTDTVFNKLDSYAKDGHYYWLKQALDFKANIKEPHEIIDKVSKPLKELALRAIKLKTGQSYEDFKGKSSKPHFIEPESQPPMHLNDAKKRTATKAIKEEFNDKYGQINGDDGLTIARLLLPYYVFEDIRANMTDSEKVDMFFEVTEWWKANGEPLYDKLSILTKLKQERKLQSDINKLSLSSYVLTTIKNLTGSMLTAISDSGKDISPFINDSTKNVIHQYLKLNTSQSVVSAVKTFRLATNYDLHASKGYVVIMYARLLLEEKPDVQNTGDPKKEMLAKIINFDGNIGLQFARFILSNYIYKQGSNLKKALDSLSAIFGNSSFGPSQQKVTLDFYTSEKALIDRYTHMTLSSFYQIAQSSYETIVMLNNSLGQFKVLLSHNTVVSMQKEIRNNDFLNAVRLFQKATGWTLKPAKEATGHFAIAMFLKEKPPGSTFVWPTK